MGVSSLAAILHAGALLLKLDRNWDWFTTLSTSDYPLFSQDGKMNAIPFQDIAIKVEHGAINMSSYNEQSTHAIFASLLRANDPMMLVIDKFILKRPQEGAVLRKWCKHGGLNVSTSNENAYGDMRSTWENIDIINKEFRVLSFEI
ncbi:unnamed protein product [Fraxinus pennsylvanica]|uniref:Uncharacterized protein n=1 Tax=Fraxinus pennsylvanica TaxID=56036 RepID=A0AAD1ZHI3_9LAMI|nr:unnamed protein product [Fraxinus pennsylvanica]